MRKIYGYARVSTREQNLDRQIIALQQYGISDRDIVTDKESGKTLERDGYTFLKNRLLRDGDVLVVKSLDRLSRNKNHIKQELEYFKSRNIRVMVLDIQTTLIDPPEGQEWIIEMINTILNSDTTVRLRYRNRRIADSSCKWRALAIILSCSDHYIILSQ